MGYVPDIFHICILVFHSYLTNTLAVLINAQCPATFEERTDAAAFGNYCHRMAFSVERVVPERYRDAICQSKCQQSEACIYYSYAPATLLCIVCLRRAWFFADPHVGSALAEYEPVPATVHARIGLQFDLNACDFLDYTCGSRWFGGANAGYTYLTIAHGERITAIQFCKDQGYHQYLGGFNITLNTDASHVRGCIYPIWQPRFEFAGDESITGLEIYYGDQYVHGLSLHTNAGNSVGDMGSVAGIDDAYCALERGDLVGIETISGSLIDSIRFHFGDC